MSFKNTPSAEQLRKAADIVEKIEALEAELTQLLTGPPAKAVLATTAGAVAVPKAKKKRGMSPEGKARVVAAQKKRWAKINAAKGKLAKTTVKAEKVAKTEVKAEAKPAKKRGMSPAAKAKMSAARKEYWAKRKAAESKPF